MGGWYARSQKISAWLFRCGDDKIGKNDRRKNFWRVDSQILVFPQNQKKRQTTLEDFCAI